jgi:hypothetical protein
MKMNKHNETNGYKIFLGLKNKNSPSNEFISVESSPFSKFHKIGISNEGYPIFFVKCNDSNKSVDINLELISVLFSKECTIREQKNTSIGRYTLIYLKTSIPDLQMYFTDVLSIILRTIDEIPSEKELSNEIGKMIDLFSKISKPSIKSIQGLWAELLVIEKSSNPDYLINAWHCTPNDKFDFNDGKDKIEVKSTSKSKRIHTFSLDQLNINKGSELLVASIFVVETGIGRNIIELKDSISQRLSDLNSKIKLTEMILKTLGNEYNCANSKYFDYQYASDSLNYYNNVDIHKIDAKCIHPSISNIKLDIDLSNIYTVKQKGYKFKESKLINSLSL